MFVDAGCYEISYVIILNRSERIVWATGWQDHDFQDDDTRLQCAVGAGRRGLIGRAGAASANSTLKPRIVVLEIMILPARSPDNAFTAI